MVDEIGVLCALRRGENGMCSAYTPSILLESYSLIYVQFHVCINLFCSRIALLSSFSDALPSVTAYATLLFLSLSVCAGGVGAAYHMRKRYKHTSDKTDVKLGVLDATLDSFGTKTDVKCDPLDA